MREDLGKAVYGHFRVPAGVQVWYRKTVEYDWKETTTTKVNNFRRCEYDKDGYMVFLELPYFLKVPKGSVVVVSLTPPWRKT
jgi:hypothetical protein